MAVGAAPGEVLRLVLGQGAMLAGIGIVLGIGMAFALTRLMAALLFGVSATDAWVFTLVPAAVALAALAAGYIPARRAAALDPLTALRAE